MPMKYAEAYVELAWRKENYDAGERQVQASIRTIGQQASDMAAKVAAASKSTSADVYELQGSVYKLAETVADVPKEMEKVEERTLATGAAMKNLGGVVGLVSPQLGGMISIAGQLQARLGVLSQAQGVNATAVGKLGTAFAGLSTTVLAFMGTPVGLMITGFTAVVGLLASARKEGESLGDTFVRLTDVIHGLASAQAQANREMERSNEISKQNFEREERKKREPMEKTPEGQKILDEQEELKTRDQQIAAKRQRIAAAEKELNTRDGTILRRSQTLMNQDEKDFSKTNFLTVSGYDFSKADLEREKKSLEMEVQQLENQKKEINAGMPALNEAKRVADTKRFFGLDPNKSGQQIQRESEAKVRQREATENREQAAAAQRREREAEAAQEQAAERRKQRDEERARKEKEQEKKREEEKARDKRARSVLRGMGLDEGERNDLGMAAAFGGIGDIVNSLSRGMDRPDQERQERQRQRFGITSAESLHAQIQQGVQNREEKEIAKKQAADISDIAEGKKAIKVELVKAIQMGAVFGP